MANNNRIQHELTQYHQQKLNRLRYIRLVTSVINKNSNNNKNFYNVDIAKKYIKKNNNKETSVSFKSNSALNLNDLNNNNDYGDLYLSKSTYFNSLNVSKSSIFIMKSLKLKLN